MRFDHRYEHADSILLEIQKEYPNRAEIYFLRGSTLQDKMVHYEDYREDHLMNCLLDTAICLARTDTTDPWNLWIIGSSYGYRAIAQAEQGEYILALRNSAKAMSFLEKAYEHSETRAEAALGIGGYFYWKSAKLGILNILPFVPDRRREGLEYLRVARDSSVYSGDAAVHALFYIFCEEEMFDSARVMRDSISSRYPASHLPLWYNLRLTSLDGSMEEYFNAADHLSAALDTVGRRQSINRIEAHSFAAFAASELGYWDFVCLHCTSILDLNFDPWVIEQSGNTIQKLSEMAHDAARNGAECPNLKE